MRPDRTDPDVGAARRAEDRQPDKIGTAHGEPGDAGTIVRVRSAAATDGDAWPGIKSQFVDDPAGAVAAAEQLVRQAVDERIRALQDEAAAVYAHDEDDASTEALRNRLIRYEAYCQRLAGSALH